MSETRVVDAVSIGADPLPAGLRYRLRFTLMGDFMAEVVRDRPFYPRVMGEARVGGPIHIGADLWSPPARALAQDRAVLDACRRAWADVHLRAEGLSTLDDLGRYTGRNLR